MILRAENFAASYNQPAKMPQLPTDSSEEPFNLMQVQAVEPVFIEPSTLAADCGNAQMRRDIDHNRDVITGFVYELRIQMAITLLRKPMDYARVFAVTFKPNA